MRTNMENKDKKMIKFLGIELEEGTFIREDCGSYFALYDLKYNLIYCEYDDSNWYKYGYDENGNPTYFETSNNGWVETKFNKQDLIKEQYKIIKQAMMKVLDLTNEDYVTSSVFKNKTFHIFGVCDNKKSEIDLLENISNGETCQKLGENDIEEIEE